MVLYESIKFVISTVLIIIAYEIVGNSLGGNLYNLLDDKRDTISLIYERAGNPQIYNGTIYENGIAHVEINELNPKLSTIKIFEDTFRKIITMSGIKYTYKRNFYWRTWREVNDSKGNPLLICYRCLNVRNITCTSCNCGYWEIEENPPCPFEIISVINNTNMCVAYYNQLKNTNAKCPSIISFKDLLKCDNPIQSRWRVIRQYDTNISERYFNVICKERENCEFSTIYSIFPDRITYKIINASNLIVYSKIMKNNNRNYACLNDCGVFKPTLSTKIKLQDQTLPFSTVKHNTEKNYSNKRHTPKDSRSKVNLNSSKPYWLKIHRSTLHTTLNSTTTSTLHCKHLKNTHSEEEYEESEYKDY